MQSYVLEPFLMCPQFFTAPPPCTHTVERLQMPIPTFLLCEFVNYPARISSYEQKATSAAQLHLSLLKYCLVLKKLYHLFWLKPKLNKDDKLSLLLPLLAWYYCISGMGRR